MKILGYFFGVMRICLLAIALIVFVGGGHVVAEEPMSAPAMVLSFQDISDPQQRLEKMLELASSESNARRAALYAEMAIHLADSLNIAEKKFDALFQSGIAWKNAGDYTKSIDRFTEAAGYIDEDDKITAAALNRNLGETHRAARNYATSLSLLYMALEVFVDTDNTLELCKTYNRLAAVYQELIFVNPQHTEMLNQIKHTGAHYSVVLPNYPILLNFSDSVIYFADKATRLASAIDNKALFSVIDSGIGIPQEQLPDLFSFGSKPNRMGTDNEQSAGLGLILCKEFVEKHGGRIWAKSAEGRGAAFYFTIPSQNRQVDL